MKRAAMAMAMALVLLAAACSEEEPISSVEGVAAAGEAVFVEYCSECHADDLMGNEDGPSLLEPEYMLPGFPDTEMLHHIRHGEIEPEGDYDPMPGFPNLGRQSIADVMAYVRAVQAATP
ncbi:cytochrome c [bacterium]|nr:cytochrome c [bacterium]